jgi:hypothetical protein
MFNSLLTPDRVSEQDGEAVPHTSLPWVWPGFIFAFAFFAAEVVSLALAWEDADTSILFLIIVLAGTAYWLFCVYRFHQVLNQMARRSYPVSPGEAVWKHFVPILNLIWLFQWPSEMSDYLNARGRVRMISGKLIGLLLLLSFLLRFFDGAVGLAFTFGVGLYISAKLRAHVRLLKESSLSPPAPTRDLFGYTPQAVNQPEQL